HVERGEDVLSPSKRELFEETGIIAGLCLCGTLSINIAKQECERLTQILLFVKSTLIRLDDNMYIFEMNVIKDFFLTLVILGFLVAIPFMLIPDLLDNLNKLGIRMLSLGLLVALLIILAIPVGRGRT
ncbi:MAG TPA: hypothetical protein VN843_23600, partial [Anaerolineales bacterium]|nr:hypothetical protein [Anaerolineales bacterium]